MSVPPTLQIVPIVIEVHDNGVSSLARLKVGNHVIAYASGSRYVAPLVDTLTLDLARALQELLGIELGSQYELSERWNREVG